MESKARQWCHRENQESRRARSRTRTRQRALLDQMLELLQTTLQKLLEGAGFRLRQLSRRMSKVPIDKYRQKHVDVIIMVGGKKAKNHFSLDQIFT